MTQPTDAQIDRILRYIDALRANPGAAPPPDLDAADIALARDLARTFVPPAIRNTMGNAQRQRIWQRALAEAVRQRLAGGTLPAQSHTHIQSNGRFARQETESMLAQPAISQPVPRTTSNAIWLTGLVAAVCALVIGGLLLAGLDDSKPPDTGPDAGAGAGVTTDGDQQIDDATPTITATPTATPTLIVTSTATPIQAFITVVTPTPVPMQPSSTPTATPIIATVSAPSPVPMLPSSGPTAVPFFPRPTLSPDDLTGIEEWLVIDEFAAGETLWSNDGRYLYVAHGRTVEIHDMQSPQVRMASNHEGNITAMAINFFGTVLATGAEDGEVHIHILPEAANWVGLDICDACTITEVAFNPTGSIVMIRTEDDGLHIYHLPEVFYR